MSKKTAALGIVLSLFIGFCYGFLSHRFNFFPAPTVRKVARTVGWKKDSHLQTSYADLDVKDWYGYDRWDQFKHLFANSALHRDTKRVLWVGDSLLESMHVEHFFPESANVAVSGIGTKLLYEEREFIDAFQQDVVVLYVGGNDLDTGIACEDVFFYFQKMVEHLLARDKKIVLMGLHRQFVDHRRNEQVEQYNRLVASLARQHDLPFVPTPTGLYDASGFMMPQFAPDGEHLNSAGYQVWMDAIRPHLLRQLSKNGQRV